MDVVVRYLDSAVTYLFSHPILVAAVAAAAAWGVALLLTAVATRPRAGRAAPATMELGAEPPAVANLLVNGWGLTQEAVQATLIDLAARKYLEFDQAGEGPEQTLIRVRRRHGGGGEGDGSTGDGNARDDLNDYERMVLERVAGLAVDGVVPAQALPMGTPAAAKRWWKRFNQLVVTDAQRRGLSRKRLGTGVTAALVVGAVLPAVLLGIHLLPYDLASEGEGSSGFPAGMALFIALTSLIKSVRGQRDTDAGRERAAHWLGVRDYLTRDEVFPTLPPAAVTMWDRYLAYGAALGAAGTALRALPLRAASDVRAWSGYGGRWREVNIAYRRYNATHPLVRMLVAVVWLAMVGAAAYLLGRLDILEGRTDELLDAGVTGIAVLIAVLVVASLISFLTKPSQVEVEGQVLRLRTRGGSDDSPPTYYVAVDDGTADRIEAWPLTSASLYASMREGAIVRVTRRPRRGHIDAVTVVRASAWADIESVEPDTAEMPHPVQEVARAWIEARPDLSPAELVSAEDASAALGEPVKDVDLSGLPQILPVAQHVWYSQASSRRWVMVQLIEGGMARAARRMNERRGTPLDGIGDAAVFQSKEAVLVFRGDQTLMIRLHSNRVPDTRAALTTLARAADERLQALSGGREPLQQ